MIRDYFLVGTLVGVVAFICWFCGVKFGKQQTAQHGWGRWSEPAREFGASVFGDGDVWTQRRVDTNTGYAEFRIVGRMGKRP